MEPNNTAIRTALWRALHVKIDTPPLIFEDELGLRLADPPPGWESRPDMDPEFTKRLRASMVARARFVEDLLAQEVTSGIHQYVIIGAGLDTFAFRNPELASLVEIFEIDQTETLQWKEKRLTEIGLSIPKNLHFVSVDFEVDSWLLKLTRSGFDPHKPGFFSCTGVSLYLSKVAISSLLEQITHLQSGTVIAITLYLPLDLLEEPDRYLHQIAEKGAREAGTPFHSFFTSEEILQLAERMKFRKFETIDHIELRKRYFEARTDGFTVASGEVFLVGLV
ncbi:MAG: class I SAM-dependent methyltransferase [Bacteroidota bacterium]|nr:class I SAM-dependent methyltransferase [Bacteroidota bacterium]